MSRRGARSRRVRRRLEVGAGIVIAGTLGFLAWLFLVYPGTMRARGRGASELTVVIRDTDSIDNVAAELERLGAVEHPRIFALYARLLGADERLRRGPIRLRTDMPVRVILARLAEGLGETPVDVVVPEGFDRHEIAARLARWGVCERDAFLAATVDRALLDELGIAGPSAEGYLHPDTYRFMTDSDPRDVVRRFVRRHRARVEPLVSADPAVLDAEARAARERLHRLGLGVHEVVTLASIVEREAAVHDERPVIAGVFLNRLESETFLPRRRLQADPTVSYGCKEQPTLPSCAGFDGRRITRAMLDDPDNTYNTYRREGLPPGPICNPGLDAIAAVLGHARHEYMYFVARGEGRHAFSRTLTEHERGVSALRRREQAAASRGELVLPSSPAPVPSRTR